MPDKHCGDYPHVEGVRDECIQEALHDLINVETDQDLGMGLSVTSPMPPGCHLDLRMDLVAAW